MGKLIVLEGTDGSGKSTQFRLLTARLKQEQRDFRELVFPQYSEPSSALIRMYLDGEFGTHPSDVNAYAASVFFAVDRYASFKKVWGDYYRQGGLIVSDRYTTSNAVHQTSKEPEASRPAFLEWLYDLEYNRMGLPRPDLVDIHEQDAAYLATCREIGRAAAKFYGWTVIDCVKNGRMRTIEDIHEEIYRHVAACLED